MFQSESCSNQSEICGNKMNLPVSGGSCSNFQNDLLSKSFQYSVPEFEAP